MGILTYLDETLENHRSLQFALIDCLLIVFLLIVYYSGNISEKSMSICLLGTFIICKFILTTGFMIRYPFKCKLGICL
jgi:hypothetical protein